MGIETHLMTPAQIDEQLARIWDSRHRAETQLASIRSYLAEDGDRVSEYSRRSYTERADALEAEIAELRAEAAPFEAEYRSRPWSRYFLVTNTNGHVHREMSCSTCFPTTTYAWIWDLSGCDEAEMVREYGEKACTVCFPDAPSNPSFAGPGRRDAAAKAERDAEKAARAAAKAAKTLEEPLQFRDTRGDRVTTVAAAKQVLRDNVETCLIAEHGNYGSDYYERLAAKVPDVDAAARAALAAKGVTDDEIATIVARADKRVRKDHGFPK